MGLPHRWQKGESGNISGLPGKPQGARTVFSNAFMADFARSWHEQGWGVLERVAAKSPEVYLGVAARLIPGDVKLTLEQHAGPLDQHDYAILRACKDAIPGVADMTPEQTFEHALAALRAYGARTVEIEPNVAPMLPNSAESEKR